MTDRKYLKAGDVWRHPSFGNLYVTDDISEKEAKKWPGMFKCYWSSGGNPNAPWTFLAPDNSLAERMTLVSEIAPRRHCCLKPQVAMTDISPAANAVWEAFNQDEAGVFVDYGDKLAAALRAAVDQVVPEQLPMLDHAGLRQNRLRHELLAIADELEALPND